MPALPARVPERRGADDARRWTRARVAGFAGGTRLFLRVMRANPLTLVGFVLVVLVLATAFLVVALPAVTAPFGHPVSIVPYDPNQLNTNAILQPPSSAHWFGTDAVGRDVFSRVLTALPLDLGIGIGIAGIALLIGLGLGLVAGYWDRPRTLGGAASTTIMRVTDVFLAFPSLVLALAISASLGPGVWQAFVAVLATWWPWYVRLVRGEVLVIKQQPYVVAARAAGVRDGRILTRHVLRNLLEPLLVYYTLDIGTVIVVFSTIVYIIGGILSGINEWGVMIEEYQDNLLTQPWLIGFVALAIFITVLAFSLLGDGLRDVLDPRSRRALASAAAGTSAAPTLVAGTAATAGEA
jgi:peptide/nickel transport system permease protein